MEAAQAPPPPAAVAGDAKRARRRSRYLSPPYTHTDDAAAAVGAALEVGAKNTAGNQRRAVVLEEEEAVVDVSAAEALSALHAAALQQGQAGAPPLRFLALYHRRRRMSTFFPNGGHHPPLVLGGDHHSDSDAAAGNHGSKAPWHKLRNLNAGPAMPMADGSPGLGSRRRYKKSVQAASAAAVTKKQQGEAMERPSQSAKGRDATADSTVKDAGGAANSAQPKKRNRKRKRNTGQEQHFSNPVALVLDFAEGTPLPSKDELLAAFRKFGSVIDSEAAIDKDKRNARVVFATRDEAEAAYSFACAETLGAFGPPLATPRLQDLPPITLNVPPPVPKLPLTDIRKNLEKMIRSLTRCSSPFKAAAANTPRDGRPAMGNLVGEMQGLLAKVDKVLQVQGASSNAHHH